MKPPGPGQRFDSELPAQSLLQRQLPGLEPQDGLLQHFTSAGSAGQAPLMLVPPEAEQAEEERQTPVCFAGVSEGMFVCLLWKRMVVWRVTELTGYSIRAVARLVHSCFDAFQGKEREEDGVELHSESA